MKAIINYQNLRNFAYSNDHLIEKDIKGIVINFYGLGDMRMFDEDPVRGVEYAMHDILYVIPYTNPWCWMNEEAVLYVDEIIRVLCEKYQLKDDIKIVSTGGSMGGLSALVYSCYAKITPIACVTNCPVCDLVYHFTERLDLPRTLYSAFFNFNGSMEEALRLRSPYHLVEKMSKIDYTIFHCEKDKAVNLELHSVKFVEAMKEKHKINLIKVPLRGHCDLSAEAMLKYEEIILSYF